VLSAVVMLATVALTPLTTRIASWARGAASGLAGTAADVLSLAVFVVVVVVVCEAAMLPAALFRALRVEEPYRRSGATVEGTLGARAQGAILAVAVGLGAGAVVWASMRIAGGWWWLPAGVVLSAVLAAAVHAAPKALTGFAEVQAFARVSLVRRLEELARRSGLSALNVVEWRVSRRDGLAALVAGSRRSRRVLISTELVREWSDDEVAVVVAHEFAHLVHRDLWWTAVCDVSIVAAGLAGAAVALHVHGTTGALESLPLVALVVAAAWTAATPMRHALSRHQERRADQYALAVTGGTDAFAAAVRRLGARYLAEERPSTLTRWFYHRHPSVQERLELANSFKQSAGLS
jgi:Zn-dependent protease with chaperone function